MLSEFEIGCLNVEGASLLLKKIGFGCSFYSMLHVNEHIKTQSFKVILRLLVNIQAFSIKNEPTEPIDKLFQESNR